MLKFSRPPFWCDTPPFDEGACTFQSNDDVLNSVFEICKNGVKYGSQDCYTDCPSREKGAYSGDMTVSGPSALWLTGDGRLMKKALEDEMETARICPGLMTVTPGSFMQEIADCSLEFPLRVLKYYELAKDQKLLREAYRICLGMIEYFRKFEREDGILCNLNEKGNLVDWPQNYLDGYDADAIGANATSAAATRPHNVLNALYVGFLMGVREIAQILGERLEVNIGQYVDTFNRVFWSPETGLYVDSEGSSHSALHANMIPLFCGIVPKENQDAVADFMMQKKLACGVRPSYFFLKGLARIGRYDDIYTILTLKDEHSWYNMVREGATTCYEAWGKEQKWNTSLCHPFASSPISIIMEDILGLRLDGTRGASHLPQGIRVRARTPMHGELTF